MEHIAFFRFPLQCVDVAFQLFHMQINTPQIGIFGAFTHSAVELRSQLIQLDIDSGNVVGVDIGLHNEGFLDAVNEWERVFLKLTHSAGKSK